MANTGWDTLERHCGFNSVVKKVLHWEQEIPVPKGRGSIDDFRLCGSLRYRRMGGPVTKGGARVGGARL